MVILLQRVLPTTFVHFSQFTGRPHKKGTGPSSTIQTTGIAKRLGTHMDKQAVRTLKDAEQI